MRPEFPTHAEDMAGGRHLTFGGLERSYVVGDFADSARGAARVPMALALHGGGGNAAKAHEEGFIVVYPNGSGRLEDSLLTWNAGHCCGDIP